MTKLLQDYQNPRKAAELQWRISIPISAFILAMIAALISGIKPRQSRYFMLLPASILYIIYVNLLFSARHWLEQGDLPIYIGMWWVHVVFAVLFFILYISRSRA